MMILSQDGMVAVNSDNVVMFEVKETETLPHETQLCATILVYNGGHFRRVIGTYHGLDRAEVAKTALDYISFSVGSAHAPKVQVPTEAKMREICERKKLAEKAFVGGSMGDIADALKSTKLDDIIKELLKEDM